MYHKPSHFQGIVFFFMGDLVFVCLYGLPPLHLNQVVGHACMYVYISTFSLPVHVSSFIVTCTNIGSNVVNVC